MSNLPISLLNFIERISVNKGVIGESKPHELIAGVSDNICLNKNRVMKSEIRRILVYKRIKVFWIWTSRIGEFIFMSLEIIRDLEKYSKLGILPVFIPQKDNFMQTNMSILKGFSREFTIINEDNLNEWKYIFKYHRERLEFDNIDYYVNHVGEKQFHRMYFVKMNAPTIHMTSYEIMMGKAMVRKMNLKENYVCFAGRDQAYLKKNMPNSDISYHEYRNCKLNDFRESIRYCNKQGLSCVLMGKEYEDTNIIENSEYINYSGKYYDEFLDWYLFSNCRFYFGDFGGVAQIPQMLGKPVVFVNFIPNPLMILRRIYKKEDICIFKKLWSDTKKRFLNLEEIWNLERCKERDGKFYRKMKICVVNNTQEEVLDVVTEMNERLNGTWIDTEEDVDNRKRYLDKFEQWCKETKRNDIDSFPIRVGCKFLRDNHYLLEKED